MTGNERRTQEEDALLLERQLCFPLYAAARQVTGAYAPYLKPLGLTYTQYLVMLVLWEEDGVTVGQICERLHLDSGTLTPLLKKLEAQGLVVRRRSGRDERKVLIALTPQGKEKKKDALGVPAAVGSCLALEPQEASALYRLLYKLLGKEEGS